MEDDLIITLSVYFKEDLKNALKTYAQARPSWIARVDPEGTLKFPERELCVTKRN